jgi:hypothetical protein
MVVKGLVPRTRPHFPNACSKGVSLCSSRLHILTTSPPNAVHVTERKVSLAIITMSVNVPCGNSNLDLDSGVKLQAFREVFHALREIFRPLTANVVREDNAGKFGTRKRRQNDIVHVAVPGQVSTCQHRERKKCE